MNAVGIIFADSYSRDERNELTRHRSSASLPVGCRFRAIDFMLSGMVDAGIRTVGVLTKQNYGSLVDHLDGGKNWDLDRKRGGLTMLTPYSRGETAVPNATAGKLDALRGITAYLNYIEGEYVILGQGNVVANLDFKDIMLHHTKNEADITVVSAEVENPGDRCMVMNIGEDNTINDVSFSEAKGKYEVSLNCYCLRKDFLMGFLSKSNLYDWHDLNRDLILRHMDSLRIVGYHHKGYAAMLNTISQYYACNLDMLKKEVRDDLFNSERPILTHIHDTVPTLYAEKSSVAGTLLADGCTINGSVKNSVLFRNVTVEEGAHIENCVIMQGAHIGKGAVLKNAICDKNVIISGGAQLIGSPAYPYVLKKGAKA